MLTVRCDRCGKTYELYVKRDKVGGRNTIRFTNYNIDGDPFYEQVYELCKDCMEKVRDFVLSFVLSKEE